MLKGKGLDKGQQKETKQTTKKNNRDGIHVRLQFRTPCEYIESGIDGLVEFLLDMNHHMD